MTDPKNTRVGLGFGDLNPISKPHTQKFYDPETTVMGSIREAMAREYKIDSLKNVGSLKGVVLRVDGTTAAGSLIAFLTNVVEPSLVQVKVRIPELHAALPEPSQYGDQNGPHQEIIDMYPTFVAANVDLPKPSPGDIVYVDFGDRENMTQPIYLGRIVNQPTCAGAVGQKNETGIAGVSNSEAQKYFEADKEFVDSIIPEVCRANERGIPPGTVLLNRAKRMSDRIKARTGVDVPVAMLMSFITVESAGRTPSSDTIRFEPHLFLGKPQKKPYSRRDLSREISYTPRAKRGEARNWFVSSKRSETKRAAFNKAFNLDPIAAISSTSFGSYQIMGSTMLKVYGDPNTALKAYDNDPLTVSDELALQFFIDKMRIKSRFKRALTSNPPIFRDIAKYYNGPAQVETYAPKLKEYYDKYRTKYPGTGAC